jgi:hypothetical protein
MMKKIKPKCILFAGMPGTGKDSIAYYLSWNLGLPMFNNDAIRLEVLEDTLKKLTEVDDNIQLKRRNIRLNRLIKSKKSFIYNASVDRRWPYLEKKLKEEKFDYFIISINISKDLYKKMAKAKNYDAAKWMTDQWRKEHDLFLAKYQDKVNLNIDNDNFKNRLNISLKAVSKFLKS